MQCQVLWRLDGLGFNHAVNAELKEEAARTISLKHEHIVRAFSFDLYPASGVIKQWDTTTKKWTPSARFEVRTEAEWVQKKQDEAAAAAATTVAAATAAVVAANGTLAVTGASGAVEEAGEKGGMVAEKKSVHECKQTLQLTLRELRSMLQAGARGNIDTFRLVVFSELGHRRASLCSGSACTARA